MHLLVTGFRLCSSFKNWPLKCELNAQQSNAVESQLEIVNEQEKRFIKPLYLQVKSVNRTKRSGHGYGSKRSRTTVSVCHNLII